MYAHDYESNEKQRIECHRRIQASSGNNSSTCGKQQRKRATERRRQRQKEITLKIQLFVYQRLGDRNNIKWKCFSSHFSLSPWNKVIEMRSIMFGLLISCSGEHDFRILFVSLCACVYPFASHMHRRFNLCNCVLAWLWMCQSVSPFSVYMENEEQRTTECCICALISFQRKLMEKRTSINNQKLCSNCFFRQRT